MFWCFSILERLLDISLNENTKTQKHPNPIHRSSFIVIFVLLRIILLVSTGGDMFQPFRIV